MNNGVNEFREAIAAAGLIPPTAIEPGKFHKFPGEGKGNRNTAAWCKLFPDSMGGIFGDYSTGLSDDWQAKREKPFSASEREAFKRHVAEARKQAEADQKERHAEAAKRAAGIWEAANPAPADNFYLARKGIEAHGARLHDGALIIPMRDRAALCSLQFIGPDGDKRFLAGGKVKGCYFSIGTMQGAAALCIAEGYATGASIHAATGHPVAVAFTAGNLGAVAKTMRERFADLPLILCADDDAATESNPGITKATEAARSVGGLLAVPDFGTDRPEGASDFNDLHQARGAEAVARAVASAAEPAMAEHQPNTGHAPAGDPASGEGDWPEPQPLAIKVEPQPYPLDALPDTIKDAVEEVHGFTKAPLPLVASSALAAVSLAIQAHVDVKRADKLTGPASLFLLTIADSGERKSTCDGFFTKSIRDYEAAQAEAAKPIWKDYKAKTEAWESKRGGIKDKIRQLAKESKPTVGMESALRDLEHDKPKPPRIPRLIYADATPEALAFGLAHQWPSGGVVSAEGGIVFGSHGMGKDSVMRNLAMLNQLWDGNSLTIDRRTSESFTVRGARLTVALQVQDATLREFFERSGTLARGCGFLARFLIAWPESTQGFRPFTDAPASWPSLAEFHLRIAEILNTPELIDDEGALSPALLSLAPEAKAAWVAFHDAIERELASGGELYEVQDVASKSADNAARLAALFHVFEHDMGGAVGLDALEGASRIAAWHLNESRRFFGELALPAELASAARLDTWLVDYCRREHTHLVPIAKLQQGGPGGLRSKAIIQTAMRELEEAGRARWVRDGKRKMIAVNPALLIDGGAS